MAESDDRLTRRDPPTTELLDAARRGDEHGIDGLFHLAYDQLRAVAHRVRARAQDGPLQTTALLHEAYVKLGGGRPLDATDRAHFLAIVGRAMRHVLVDEARQRTAKKRGGADAVMVTLDDHGASATLPVEDVLTLEAALSELESAEPRLARVVECRFLAGMSVEETAEALGVSAPTVKRDWRVARAWLGEALTR